MAQEILLGAFKEAITDGTDSTVLHVSYAGRAFEITITVDDMGPE